MKPLVARRALIEPNFFPQHEIDPEKVRALVLHLRAGGRIPPVVAVQYDVRFMPLDGHHRFASSKEIGRQLDTWIVSGRSFEALDSRCSVAGDSGRAEDFVMCDGVPARLVAERWQAENAVRGG